MKGDKWLLFDTLLFLSSVYFVSSTKDLPSYYPRCYREDPDLNGCLLRATEQMRPFLIKGVRELNLPPISPFYIPEITLEKEQASISYKAVIKDLIVTGLESYKFKEFRFDPRNLIFFGSVDMGTLYVKGNYSIDGKVLNVPIQGEGKMNATIYNSNGTMYLRAKLVKRKGLTYLEANETDVRTAIGNMKSKVDGDFKGDEVLAKATKQIVRDNIQDLMVEVKPAVDEVLKKVIENLLQKSISKVPYEKLLYPVRDKAA